MQTKQIFYTTKTYTQLYTRFIKKGNSQISQKLSLTPEILCYKYIQSLNDNNEKFIKEVNEGLSKLSSKEDFLGVIAVLTSISPFTQDEDTVLSIVDDLVGTGAEKFGNDFEEAAKLLQAFIMEVDNTMRAGDVDNYEELEAYSMDFSQLLTHTKYENDLYPDEVEI